MTKKLCITRSYNMPQDLLQRVMERAMIEQRSVSNMMCVFAEEGLQRRKQGGEDAEQ